MTTNSKSFDATHLTESADNVYTAGDPDQCRLGVSTKS